MSRLALSLVSLLLLAMGSPAWAALSATLSASIKNSARGQEIVFSGTLTNTSGTDKLFLNDIVPVFSGASAPNLALKPNSFFSNVPGILLPGESYTESELFRIGLSAAAPSGDYAGVVTFRGGADIFASSDLASPAFTVLSPAVSIAATDASASEIGPDPATVVVSRSGSAAIDLQVFFSIGGTATNGIAYNAIAPSVILPAGSSSATITILPVPNNLAEGDRSVLLSLGNFSTYNLGAPAESTLTIHDKPSDRWRFENFGANANDPAAADGADWDGDGIQNLAEFALGADPKVSDRTALPAVTAVSDYLTISYLPNPEATDVNYIVEAATDLSNWSSADIEPVNVINPNPPGLRTFRYRIPISQSENVFLRLRLERNDLTTGGPGLKRVQKFAR